MIAANRRGRNGGRRSSGGGGRSIHHSRRGVGRTTSLLKVGSAAAIGWGLTYPWTANQSSTRWGLVSSLTQKDFTGAVSNLKESIPLIGKDSGHQSNRYAVGAGMVGLGIAHVLKHNFPALNKYLRAAHVKTGRKKQIALN